MDNPETLTIMFTRDTDPEREGAEFKAGEFATLNAASAHRWLKRNAAVAAPRSAAKAQEHAEIKEIEARVEAELEAKTKAPAEVKQHQPAKK